MNLIRGENPASMMNPPNHGTIADHGFRWKIGRNSYGLIVLRPDDPKIPMNVRCHPDFVDGMDMHRFVSWINQCEGA